MRKIEALPAIENIQDTDLFLVTAYNSDDSIYESKKMTSAQIKSQMKVASSAHADAATADDEGNTISDYIKGISISGTTVSIQKGDGTSSTQTTQDTTYNTGNASTAGITKLYTTSGNNEDGAVTQKVASTIIAKSTGSANDTSSQLYLIGAADQNTEVKETKSNVNAFIYNNHLYSNSNQVVNISDTQALTNKTYNGYTLADACAKAVLDNSAATALTSTGTDVVTERTVYYGLPKINNSHDYTSSTAIFTPTSAGTAGYDLVARGSNKSPVWKPKNYGACSTAADTAAKEVAITNFYLTAGETVAVSFQYANTASAPTLNVNSTGDKSIYCDGLAITDALAATIKANVIYFFVYDGTYWHILNLSSAKGIADLASSINTITNTTIPGVISDYQDADEAIASDLSDLTTVVNAIHSFELLIVDELPVSGTSNIIYLVPIDYSGNSLSEEANNLFEEYIWVTTTEEVEPEQEGDPTEVSISYFERIAISSVDLVSYYTKTEVDTLITSAKKCAASSNKAATKLFLVGTTSQKSTGQTAYSNVNVYIGTDNHLYSNTVQVVNLSDSQALTNKTYEGYTLAAACAKAVLDNSSATAIGTGTSLVTERSVYYGLPTINNDHTYTSSSTFFAPTGAGTAGDELVAVGSNNAPVWKGKNFANCSTAASTAAKTVSITNFKLTAGTEVFVTFTNTNTANSPTLNVSSTGAKSIYVDGAAISNEFAATLATGKVYHFVYNGTYWVLLNLQTGADLYDCGNEG